MRSRFDSLPSAILVAAGFGLAGLLLASVSFGRDGEADASRLGWMRFLPPGEVAAEQAAGAAMRALGDVPVAWRAGQDLLNDLREHDLLSDTLRKAGQLLSQGREMHLGLKLDLAIRKYRLAIGLLQDGFVRYYEPGRLAEPVLQLGVALLQAGQKDEAHKALMRAVALSPELELSQGYYSPTVREAFDRARLDLGILAPGIPLPTELIRICTAAGLTGMVVASVERMGERQVFRLSLFDGRSGTLHSVETAVLSTANPAGAGEQAAARLRPALRQMLGLHPEDFADGGVPAAVDAGPAKASDGGAPDGGVSDGDQALDGGLETADGARAVKLDLDAGLAAADVEPVSPWYVEYWWIWPLAAGVVATAVALPLTVFREDVIDVRVRY